jgi:hypothetical protein
MAHEELARTLAALHAALSQHPHLEVEDRARLEAAVAEIQQALVAASAPSDSSSTTNPTTSLAEDTLVHRLQAAALRFEGKHPALTLGVEQVIAAVRRVGM